MITSEKPNALIVEDNEINLEIIERYITDICAVDSINNGTDAIGMASKKKYDIVLMDINLGNDIDGITTTKEIKKMAEYSDVPFVALTGYAMSGDKEKLLNLGLTHYLSKPFEKEELSSLIKKILSL